MGFETVGRYAITKSSYYFLSLHNLIVECIYKEDILFNEVYNALGARKYFH